MFRDILRNVWGHSPEYNILPVPRVPHIPFPVPVFLVLYIAEVFRELFLYEHRHKGRLSRKNLSLKNFTYKLKILLTRNCRRSFVKNLPTEKRKENM